MFSNKRGVTPSLTPDLWSAIPDPSDPARVYDAAARALAASVPVTDDVLLSLERLLCAGDADTGAVMARLAAAVQPKVCPAVWGNGTFFYRCHDCEKTPSSCVCVECFKGGSHEGHDVTLETSVHGGSCDCGNDEAWKESGFCSRHGRRPDPGEDPLRYLPESMRVSAPAVLAAASAAAVAALQDARPESRKHGAIIAQWLRRLAKVEALMRVLRAVFGGRAAGAPPGLLGQLSEALVAPRGETLEACLYLLLDMVQDLSSKKDMAPHFTALYRGWAKPGSFDADTFEAIVKLNPQMLNSLAATDAVFPESGQSFLTALLEVACESMPIAMRREYGQVDAPDNTIEKKTSRLIVSALSDVVVVLSHDDICERLRTDSRELFQRSVVVLSAFAADLHGKDGELRKEGDHVEHESHLFLWTLEFELELLMSVPGFIRSAADKADIALPFLQRLVDLFAASPEPRMHTVLGVEIPDIVTGSVPIGVTLPLHRVLARVLGDAPEIVTGVVQTLTPVQRALLFEAPAQLQAWYAQVVSNLWIRNGAASQWKAILYSKALLRDMSRLDIYMLQIAATVLGPNDAVALLVDRYGLSHWLTGSPEEGDRFGAMKDASTRQQSSVLSHLLGTFSAVVRDRSIAHPAMSLKELATLDLVHNLASKQQTRSSMEELLSSQREPLLREAFQAAIADVAVLNPPREGKPALFSLQQSYWELFDPFYRHMELRDLQSAFENYEKNRETKSPLWSGRTVPPICQELSGAAAVLNCPAMIEFMTAVAKNFRLHGDDCNENTLSSFLALAWLMADNPSPSGLPAPTTAAIAPLVAELEALSTTSLKVFSFNTALQSSAHDLVLAFRKAYPGLCPSSAPTPSEGAASSSPPAHGLSEAKKEMARKRQAALLEAMAKQQREYLANAAPEDIDMEDEAGEEGAGSASPADGPKAEELICVLCKQASSGVENDPHVMIAHLQPSNIPWIARNRPNVQAELGSVSDGKWTLPRRASSKKADPFWKRGYYQKNADVKAAWLNIEEQTCSQFSGCQHKVHSSCFEAHFKASLRSYTGNAIVPAAGDFLCPICRRIENAAIPIVPPDATSPAQLTPPPDGDWLEHLKRATSSHDTDDAFVRPGTQTAIMQYTGRTVAGAINGQDIKTTSPTEMALTADIILCDSVASGVAGAEIFLRSAATEFAGVADAATYWPHQAKILRAVLAATRVAQTALPKCPEFLAIPELLGIHSAAASSIASSCPFAVAGPQCDPFTWLVRYCMTRGFSCFHGASSLLYVLSVTQALVHVSRCVGSGSVEMPSADGAPPLLLSLFTAINMIISRGSLRQPTFEGPSQALLGDSPKTLAGVVDSLTETYLRRAFLLQRLLQSSESESEDIGVLHLGEADALREALHIEPFTGLAKSTELKDIVMGWVGDFVAKRPEWVALPPAPALPVSLIPLPELYQDVQIALHGIVCPQCGKRPAKSFLCLVCGAIECLGPCCATGRMGPLNRHTDMCGDGVAVVLLLDSGFSLVMRGTYDGRRRGLSGALYLDKFGEADPGMKRGKPLELSHTALAHLEYLWLAHAFDQDTYTVDNTLADPHRSV
eukprot:m51a1_g5456 hypothetical protein (1579) ;mRNA; f:224805-229966